MLSILIPSRNEMFLKRTIEDILENIEADTEIIATVGPEWADPPIEDHERVTLVHCGTAPGQRGGTNLACKLAKGKYVMKVDAHCSFDKGFDRKMIEAFEKTGDDVIMVPIMRNLWAFDWKCYKCGSKWYQGPTPTQCMKKGKDGKVVPNEDCDETKNFRRKMMWVGKERPQSTSYCFDSEPHFQYANEYKKKPGYKNGIIVGYDLSVVLDPLAPDSLMSSSPSPLSRSQPSPVAGVVSLLADFASSHHLASSANPFGFGENVSVNTMSLPSIDDSGSVGVSEVLGVGDESEVGRITTTPVLAEVVNNGNVLTPSAGDSADEPCVDKAVRHFMLPEVGQVSISDSIVSPTPIPTVGDTINSDIIKELNDELGGEFVYSEEAGSFHNGSVVLVPVYDKAITETMGLQGSCFMLTREKYWELDISDENLGSWGNQGIEIGCKAWLSGHRVLCNHNTWYAHMFRTQGGDFSFPWPNSGRDVKKTKNNVRDLFWENKWPQQIHPLRWLVEKFMPVNGWSEEDLAKLPRELPAKV